MSDQRMPEELDSDVLIEYTQKYYEDALKTIRKEGFASPALLQRKLKISYQLSNEIIKRFEVNGVISPADGARPRHLL